ncbi:hypothetical protein G9F32_06020 [Acinetobacter sp. 194]|uniref:DUF6670 family protein n=1 Tax=Acinetobacter shaoyimingii TaxID=2715164 RepID=UPI00140C2AE8|nr:DUF6670 family protein [Acinetobacter shaoyimingii]NHB57596.1 hypothetical protein [Acinetobacter shaoyimingii]
MLTFISSIPKNKTVQQKVKYRTGQFAARMLGAVSPADQSHLPKNYNFDAHVFHPQFASTHYGVMIPDLPEPFRYLSYASVIGDVGAKITKTSSKISPYTPADTATLVHGTALSSAKEAYRVYSIEDEIKFQQTPFKVEYAGDSTLYAEEGQYRLISSLEDLRVDLTLTPTDAITWFAHGPFYQHFSVLMRYEGSISQQGTHIDVQGLCTLEHWKSVAVSMLPSEFLKRQLTVPLNAFSYQVINLDDKQQLVLAFVAFAGQPAYTAVSYRHVDGTSLQYDDAVFEVIALKTESQITPDGFVMEVPQSFRWVVYHQGEQVFESIAVVDTPYCYGLAAGYVSSYQWSGEFQGHKMQGRGYLEYIDRR